MFRWRPCLSLIWYSFRQCDKSKRNDICKVRLKTILLSHLHPRGNDWNDWSNQQIVHISTAGECLESVKFTKWCDFNVAVDNLAIMLGACATMPIENGPETKMANLAGFQNFISMIYQSYSNLARTKIWVQYKNFQCANNKILLKAAWKSFNFDFFPIQHKRAKLVLWDKRAFVSDICPKKRKLFV